MRRHRQLLAALWLATLMLGATYAEPGERGPIALAGFAVAGGGADLGTTLAYRGRPGLREGNPLLPHSSAGIVAVRGGAVVVAGVTGWKLCKRGHRGWGRGVLIFVGASAAASAARNVWVARRVR